jgi:transcriptional regulator with XRE-family HTH domain
MTTSDVRGYYISTRKRLEQADQSHIGVQLGLLCIDHNISVHAVSRRLKVTRQTVYSWFLGQRQPSQRMTQHITELIADLKQRPL